VPVEDCHASDGEAAQVRVIEYVKQLDAALDKNYQSEKARIKALADAARATLAQYKDGLDDDAPPVCQREYATTHCQLSWHRSELARLTADNARLRGALKKLSFAAQTTGGTAGRDEALVAAIDLAQTVLEAPNDQ
jgi:hypothetical protein